MSWHPRVGGLPTPTVPVSAEGVGELEWEAGWRGWVEAPCWGRKKGFLKHTSLSPHSTQQTSSRQGVLAWVFLSGFWLIISRREGELRVQKALLYGRGARVESQRGESTEQAARVRLAQLEPAGDDTATLAWPRRGCPQTHSALLQRRPSRSPSSHFCSQTRRWRPRHRWAGCT